MAWLRTLGKMDDEFNTNLAIHDRWSVGNGPKSTDDNGRFGILRHG